MFTPKIPKVPPQNKAVHSDQHSHALDTPASASQSSSASLRQPPEASRELQDEAPVDSPELPTLHDGICATLDDTDKKDKPHDDDMMSDDEKLGLERDDDDKDADDDPVVRTIQVYVNRIPAEPSLAGDGLGAALKGEEETATSAPRVYLFQYPLRPVYRPYGDHGRLVSLKYRKQQQTVRMEYALNTDSTNFDQSQLPEVTTDDEDKSLGVERDRPDVKQVLVSVPCVPPHSSCGLGLLRGNRLYITPVTSVLQFRPDFSYLDDEQDIVRRRAEARLDTSLDSTANGSADTSTAEIPAEALENRPGDPSKGGEAASSTAKGRSTSGSRSRSGSFRQSVSGSGGSTPGLPTKQQGVLPPESEWHRYPPSRIRDMLLSEPWEPIETFYHPDSPESHELIELLSSFEVAIAAEKPGTSDRDHPDPNGTDFPVAEDPALRIMGTSTSAATGAEAETSRAEAEQQCVQYERVAGGSRVRPLLFSNDFKAYLDRLCNVRSVQAGTTDVQASGPLSYLQLSRLPCDQQVLRILQHRHVESMATIRSLLTHQVSDEELVGHLRSYGDLILGNWVCKSHLVYEGLVAHCRDLLLFLFSSGRVIVRDSVKPYMGSLPSETLTTLLKQLGDYRDNAWHFKLPVDKATIDKFPQLAKQSAEKFSKDAMKATVAKIHAAAAAHQQLGKDANDPKANAASGNVLGLLDPDLLNKAITEALRTGGAQTAATLLPSVRTLLQQQATDSLQPAAQSLHAAGVSALTEDELVTVLPRLAEAIGCDYWALRKLGNPQLDRHREVLLSLVKKHTLYPDAEESKKGISRAALLQEFETKKVRMDLPDFTFRRLMKELFINKCGFWVFKGFHKQAIKKS